MTDPKRKPNILRFIITKGGLPALLLLSVLAIPVGFIAAHFVAWPLAIAYLAGVHVTDSTALALIALPFALMIIAAVFFPR